MRMQEGVRFQSAMFATVTIQTYNHAKSLAKTLESLRTLRCPKDVDYEILVVNNNSADNTPDVIECYAKILAPRLRSVFESRQGLSHARNRALQEARGEIVCFLDDDVKVDPGWLEAVSATFIKYSAAVVGGRSYLIYPTEAGRPVWLPAKMETLLSRLDYGDKVLVNTGKDLFGLNFSVLKEVALEIGGFNTSFGRNGRTLLCGEEKDLLDRIREVGGIVVYEPNAVVGHIVPPERLKKKWFLRRIYGGAVSSERLLIAQGNTPKHLGNILLHAARCCGSVGKSMLGKDTTAQELFYKQYFAANSLGRLVETIRYTLKRNTRRIQL